MIFHTAAVGAGLTEVVAFSVDVEANADDLVNAVGHVVESQFVMHRTSGGAYVLTIEGIREIIFSIVLAVDMVEVLGQVVAAHIGHTHFLIVHEGRAGRSEIGRLGQGDGKSRVRFLDGYGESTCSVINESQSVHDEQDGHDDGDDYQDDFFEHPVVHDLGGVSSQRRSGLSASDTSRFVCASGKERIFRTFPS